MSGGGGVFDCKAKQRSLKHFTALQMRSFEVRCPKTTCPKYWRKFYVLASFIQRFDKSRHLTALSIISLFLVSFRFAVTVLLQLADSD